MRAMMFHETLRGLIEERELTQKQIAIDLHMPISTMGGYVQGTSEPDFATLKLLAEYFGVSTDYLLDVRSENARSREEDELLRVFRALTTEQKLLYLEQGKVFLRIHAKRNAISSKSTLANKNNAG